MGVEVTEVLHYIPMFLKVLRFIRQRMKAACTCAGTKIIIAEPPIRTIDKGLVTTEFIVAMLVNKYCDHLPMHRQVGRLVKSAKVKIAESSICRWRDQVADQLEPLVKLMKSELKKSYCINTDASPAPVRKESDSVDGVPERSLPHVLYHDARFLCRSIWHQSINWFFGQACLQGERCTEKHLRSTGSPVTEGKAFAF
jgi:transposase